MNPAAPPPVTPWYRQLWPWLLMSMPATAIVAGAITLWLALSTNNSLVVDDYYREGKAINLTLARDKQAEQLGLHAELHRQPDGSASLSLSRASPGALPPFVTVLLVHATRSELDRKLSLAAGGMPGEYVTQQTDLPSTGRWNIMIEDPERNWRLVASANGLEQPIQFGSNNKPR